MTVVTLVMLFGIQQMSEAIINENLQGSVDSSHEVIQTATKNGVTAYLEGHLSSITSNQDFIQAMCNGHRQRL